MPSERLHIVADENIPGLAIAEATFGAFEKVPAAEITREKLRSADALLVRSVTKVGRPLLQGTSVRFVGTATAGTDHVDADYLRSAGIAFAYAPGSNAESVVEYVLAALLVLCTREARDLRRLTVGVVGCGQIGERLARRLEAASVRVLRNDPPLESQRSNRYISLEELLLEADIVTLHTPLVRHARYATYHLLGREQLWTMKDGAWLVNASRGSVVDGDALLRALESGKVRHAVLDVWEGEPSISSDLFARASIATPHIAGYSYDAKLAGTEMVMGALRDRFRVPSSYDRAEELSLAALNLPDPALPFPEGMRFLVDQMYDITADDLRLRQATARVGVAEAFTQLRRSYPDRRSFRRFAICSGSLAPAVELAVQDLLQVTVRPGAIV